jgi:hypothetical protein
VDRDRLLRGVALGEVVALEHARHGVLRGERIMSAAVIAPNHSLLKRTSVRSRSSTLNTWSA